MSVMIPSSHYHHETTQFVLLRITALILVLLFSLHLIPLGGSVELIFLFHFLLSAVISILTPLSYCHSHTTSMSSSVDLFLLINSLYWFYKMKKKTNSETVTVFLALSPIWIVTDDRSNSVARLCGSEQLFSTDWSL